MTRDKINVKVKRNIISGIGWGRESHEIGQKGITKTCRVKIISGISVYYVRCRIGIRKYIFREKLHL